MRTSFKLQPLQKENDLDIEGFQQSLPAGFFVERQADGVYLSVETAVEEDERSQYLVDREIDRLFYLTGVHFRTEMCRRSLSVEFKASLNTNVSFSTGIEPLNWTYELALQLRLWAVAAQVSDPPTRILLLFQIIELSGPQYLSYQDSACPPEPLTECKMLRHLVAHAGEVTQPGLKKYCAYLGIPPLMLDRTDPSYISILSNKVPIVEAEARKCLQSAA